MDVPARHFWNAELMRKNLPSVIVSDDRPGAPKDNFFWTGDHGQVGWVLHGYRSAWLPASLLKSDQQPRLVDALRQQPPLECVLHFNKGLAGRLPKNWRRPGHRNESHCFRCVCFSDHRHGRPPAFPGIPKAMSLDAAVARQHAHEIGTAMDGLLKVVTKAGSYVPESDSFERSWQQSSSGVRNYTRLRQVKEA